MSALPSILIVDDKPQNLFALRKSLAALEVSVVEATSGNEALTATLYHEFALAILDVQMPGMDGLELAALLHGDERTRHIPVIFLTAAYGEEERILLGYEAGAVDYLVKPFLAPVLLAKVRIFLQLDAQRRALEGYGLGLAAVVAERTAELQSALVELEIQRDNAEQRARALDEAWAEQERTRERERLFGAVLESLNHERPGVDPVHEILRMIRESTGLESVGIRWRHRDFLHSDPPEATGIPTEQSVFFETSVRIPLLVGGETVGELRFEDRRPDQITTEVQGFFERLGVSVAIALERQKTEVELRRLRQGVEGSSDAIMVTDPDGLITFINPSFTRLFGYSAAEVVGRATPRILKSGLVAEDVYADFWRRLLAKEEVTVEFVNRDKGGQLVTVEVSANAVVDPSGQIVAFLSVQRDVTERRRTERALEETRAFNDSLLRAISFPMNVVDETGRILFMNEAMRTLLGPDVVLPADARCWEVYRDDRTQCKDCPLGQKRPFAGRSTREVTQIFGGRTAEIHHTDMIFDGRPARLEMFNDVTETRQLQGQVAQSERLSTMGLLAAGVAHEINNPLTYVLYNIESLAEDLPRVTEALGRRNQALALAEGREAIDRAMTAESDALGPAAIEDRVARLQDTLSGTVRIREIARSLSTFARVEESTISPVDLHRAIDHAADMALNEFKYRARLTKDFGRLPAVLGSEGKLAQVFLNLIINASHAIDEGHLEDNEIRIRTWTEGDRVFASVTDTGPGVPEALSERIFEPFFTTKGRGTGLGLAICRKIIQDFGGGIRLASPPGQGASFLIDLPNLPETMKARRGVSAGETVASAERRGRILVVDDEEGIRKVVVRLLGTEHEVVTAASGDEAQAILLTDTDFDVVLCDLMMPRVSGVELHGWLVARSPMLADRVVFVTGGVFSPGAAEYLDRVGNLRVDKPFSAEILGRIVREFIGSPSG